MAGFRVGVLSEKLRSSFLKVNRLSEAEIVAGCQRGERRCQDALVKIFAPYLFTICKRYTKNSYLADDALQETFIRVFKYIKNYKGQGDLRAWLRKVAITTSLQTIQHPAYRDYQDLDDWESVELPVAVSQFSTEEILELIEKLPEGYRTVFNLYVIDGYQHREIAELLQISESASRSQLTRARKYLIQLLTTNE